MSQFAPAYQIVNRNEGGYVKNPADPGGETYRGIARNFFPNWAGWTVIDFFKSAYGAIPTNAKISTIYPPGSWVDTQLVPEFYQQLWNQSRAGEIIDQNVANIYFDFFVLHSQAVKAMQEVLNALGKNVAIDNRIGPQTLAAINSTAPALLHDAYKLMRQKYHDKKRSSEFYEGWTARNSKFPDLFRGKLPIGTPNDKKTLNTFLIVALVGAGIATFLWGEGEYQKSKFNHAAA